MTTGEGAVRVGLWPAAMKGGNPFAGIYAAAVADAGITMVDVQRPLKLSGYAIDLLHIHWPDQLYWGRKGLASDWLRTVLFLRQLRRARRSGVKIVWMVHNLDPHDLTPLRRRLWDYYKRNLCALLDGFMTVSPGTLGPVLEAMPALRGKPHAALWHPCYPRVPVGQAAEAIRAGLQVPAGGRLYGCLGFMRPYKGIEALIAAFRRIPGADDRLVIAGKPADAAYLAKVEAAAEGDARILIRPESLDDQHYADLERACDFLVLPFSKSLHSGSLIHSISAPVAAITPRSPFSRALQEEVGAEWVRLYDGDLRPEDLADAVPPAGEPKLDALEPGVIGRQAARFYRGLVRKG